jgi:hypothetical protein
MTACAAETLNNAAIHGEIAALRPYLSVFLWTKPLIVHINHLKTTTPFCMPSLYTLDNNGKLASTRE